MYSLDSKRAKCIVFIALIHVHPVTAVVADTGQIRIQQQGQKGAVFIDAGPSSENYDLKIHQSGIENMLDVGISSSSTVVANQHGDYGLVDLELRGEDDFIQIEQTGSFNAIIGTVKGQSNQSHVNQSGHKNQMHLAIGGSYNTYRLQQSGIENKLTLNHSGHGEYMNIDQSGQKNIIEVDYSSSNVGLEVEQEGTGGLVRITN